VTIEQQQDTITADFAGAELPSSPVSPGLIAGETDADRTGLSGPQRRYVDELADRLRARTDEVTRLNGHYPRRLAESRAWANFHPALKKLLVPIVIDRAAGAQAWDNAGNGYTDYCMGFGVHFFGHNPEFVTDAVQRQLARTYSIGNQVAQTYELADHFCRITGHDRVTFCCTGSESVLGAMRLARLATGRRKIAYFRKSYHGLADVVLATEAGGRPGEAATAGRGLSPGSVGEAIVLPYGADSSLDYLRAQAGNIAAVLVEPVQNRNISVQPADFLHRLRQLATASGMVLIFDEMITGFRIGLRGAQGYFGVKPDLATYGKILGGGLPIGAIAGSAELVDGMDGGSWRYDDDSAPTAPTIVFGGTFQKHPLAMSAAGAVLSYLEARGEDLYTEVNGRARAAVEALAKIFAEEGLPYSVASFGTVWRFEYHGPPDPAQPLQFDMLYHSLVAEGIYVWKGRSFFLSTAHSDAHVEQLLAAVRRSISRLRAAGFLPSDGRHEAVEPRG
jgi:iturin family lipopeptide synthetase A